MAKKSNKEKKDKDNEQEEESFQVKLKGDVKRGIATVFLFLMAILFSFGFLGAGGALGKFLNKIGGSIFGWGKWLFPLALVFSGIILLYRKKASFYILKIMGIAVIFVSLLGFIHIFYEREHFLEIAKLGEGGGYVGYAISAMLVKFTGKAAGVIVLLALMAIGAMVAFNLSISEFFEKIMKKKDESEADVSGDKEYLNNEDILENSILESDEINKGDQMDKEKDLKDNIKGIKFVEGPASNEDWVDEDEDEDSGSSSRNMDVSKRAIRKKSKSDDSVEWMLPPMDLLEESRGDVQSGNVEENIEIIKDTFYNFGIELEMGEVKVGPMVTQYSFRPAVGVKLSKIVALSDDLALALAAHPIRIEAPIPGKSLIGIEVPNKKGVIVRLKEILESSEFEDNKSNLKLALGKDVEGNYIVGSLDKMPHLLVAGATGTGKSICINALILSLIYQYSPEDLKLILVDPKRVELSRFNKIPHLLSDVIVDNNKVVNALKWAVGEMESRYKLLESIGSRDLESYYIKFTQGVKRKYIDPDTGEKVTEDLKKLPYIVIIIDELADLMVSYGKEVEGVIMRLAQMARAVGIHLVISTQRPSVEILTGIIKANIPSRIALQVASQIDSRTILDMGGAEKLLGKGDMLFLSASSPKPKRIQSAFVSEGEVLRAVNFIKKQYSQIKKNSADNDEEEKEDITRAKMNGNGSGSGQVDFSQAPDSNEVDHLYEEAKNIVIEYKKASASFLQRRLRIGYNRAARMIEDMERDGIVGPSEGSKPREIIAAGEGVPVEDKVNYEDPLTDQAQREKWEV